MPRLLNELKTQGIDDYQFWDSVILPSIKESINKAHKQIVEDAYNRQLPFIIIAEDDFKGTHPNSWKFYLSKMPERFDLYLGGIFLGDLDENNRVEKFTGLTLYTVSQKYYPAFLTTETNDHLDHVLSNQGGDFHVCNPFPFIQYDGLSSNTGKYESYSEMFKFRKLYNG
jgi:hypothetical protein